MRPKARLPKGFVDRQGHEVLASQAMIAKIIEVFDLYGFEGLETPFFEYTDCLGKFLPDQDRPNAGVFSLQDEDNQWLSLRYDLTAPLARFVAENYQDLAKPYRGYRTGWVFRNEKPGPGRFRQFMQVDADLVGAPGPEADAEICMLAAEVYNRLGFETGEVQVKVNNRKLLDGILVLALGDNFDDATRLGVLRAIDKLDRLGLKGVEALLGEGRLDASGDFTKGAGLDEAARRAILSFLEVEQAGQGDKLDVLDALVGASQIGQEGLEELKVIEAISRRCGYGEDQIKIDPSIVRGLEYYTGPVLEVAWLNPDRQGEFGALGGGGRYDGLIQRFRSEAVPATGFSVGVSRVLAALESRSRQADRRGPVVVTVMDKERLGDYLDMVTSLRRAGIRAEAYLGGSGMKAQMKYANRRSSPLVVIQGSDEAAKGKVMIKDLDQGAKMASEIETNEAWRQERPAQVEVDLADLVGEIKARLGKTEA